MIECIGTLLGGEIILSIKLIVTDMDGTLLNGTMDISDRATEAIYRAQESGLEFAVATGRTVKSGYGMVKEKGITCPFIELNGARMFDANEELQFTRAIDKDETKALIEIMDKYGIHNEFYTEDAIYSSHSMDEYMKSFKAVFQSINRSLSDAEVTEMVAGRLHDFNIQTVDDYGFLYQDPKIKVLKAIFNTVDDEAILGEIKNDIESTLTNLIVTSASSKNIEINNKLANKGQAVSEYAAMRGYKPNEVITIGDNINDVTMLQWSEHSYAVSNAHTIAKKAATYSAPSHEEDAVAQIIHRVLDGKSLRFA